MGLLLYGERYTVIDLSTVNFVFSADCLLKKAAEEAGCTSVNAEVGAFADGEEKVWVDVNKLGGGDDTFVLHDSKNSVWSLLMILDAVKRACVGRIFVICPYLPYSRQDRGFPEGYPISAKLVADSISKTADAIFTLDVHSEQVQGFYNIPFINIMPTKAFAHALTKMSERGTDTVIVAPDAGGLKRAQAVSAATELPLAIINKHRSGPGVTKAINMFGDVKDKVCAIIDDIIDGGSTIINAATMLKRGHGASSVIAMVTHPVLSGNAMKKIVDSELDMLFVTDTLPLREQHPKIESVSMHTLILDAISNLIRR